MRLPDIVRFEKFEYVGRVRTRQLLITRANTVNLSGISCLLAILPCISLRSEAILRFCSSERLLGPFDQPIDTRRRQYQREINEHLFFRVFEERERKKSKGEEKVL